MKERVTILTTTHCVASAHRIQAGYPANHDRKNSKTDLIENTISTLYEYNPKFRECSHVISLDHNPNFESSVEYLNNLQNLKSKFPNVSVIVTEEGIFNSIRNLIHSVKTDYYLWFEHDWQFVKPVDFDNLINLFDTQKHINYVRFNKRSTIIAGCDTKLVNSNIDNLTITSGWSNNPYFGRSSFFKEKIDLLIDKKNKNVTVEEDFQSMYRDDIKKLGMGEAEKKWGIYIYGKLNDTQVVKHLNGRVL